MPDEEAIISEVRYLAGRHAGRCGGHKRDGGGAHYPGRPHGMPYCATDVERRQEPPWYVNRMPGGVREGGCETSPYSIPPLHAAHLTSSLANYPISALLCSH